MLVVLVWKTFWQKIKSFQVTPYFKFFWHNNVGKKKLTCTYNPSHLHIFFNFFPQSLSQQTSFKDIFVNYKTE